MDKHFEFTGETIDHDCRVLHRIRAIRDIPQHNVKAGDIGGFIETLDNLRDNAWVFGNAKVYDKATVFGNAKVYDKATVFGNALVSDNVMVCDYAKVFGNATVFGNAWICCNVKIYDNVKISGILTISGVAVISGNGFIEQLSDFVVIGPAASSGRYTTAHRDSEIGVRINTGCFSGAMDEFYSKIKKTHSDNEQFRRQYLGFFSLISNHFHIFNEQHRKTLQKTD